MTETPLDDCPFISTLTRATVKEHRKSLQLCLCRRLGRGLLETERTFKPCFELAAYSVAGQVGVHSATVGSMAKALAWSTFWAWLCLLCWPLCAFSNSVGSEVARSPEESIDCKTAEAQKMPGELGGVYYY